MARKKASNVILHHKKAAARPARSVKAQVAKRRKVGGIDRSIGVGVEQDASQEKGVSVKEEVDVKEESVFEKELEIKKEPLVDKVANTQQKPQKISKKRKVSSRICTRCGEEAYGANGGCCEDKEESEEEEEESEEEESEEDESEEEESEEVSDSNDTRKITQERLYEAAIEGECLFCGCSTRGYYNRGCCSTSTGQRYFLESDRESERSEDW